MAFVRRCLWEKLQDRAFGGRPLPRMKRSGPGSRSGEPYALPPSEPVDEPTAETASVRTDAGEEMVAVRSEDSDEEFIEYLKRFEDPGAFIDFHTIGQPAWKLGEPPKKRKGSRKRKKKSIEGPQQCTRVLIINVPVDFLCLWYTFLLKGAASHQAPGRRGGCHTARPRPLPTPPSPLGVGSGGDDEGGAGRTPELCPGPRRWRIGGRRDSGALRRGCGCASRGLRIRLVGRFSFASRGTQARTRSSGWGSHRRNPLNRARPPRTGRSSSCQLLLGPSTR